MLLVNCSSNSVVNSKQYFNAIHVYFICMDSLQDFPRKSRFFKIKEQQQNIHSFLIYDQLNPFKFSFEQQEAPTMNGQTTVDIENDL